MENDTGQRWTTWLLWKEGNSGAEIWRRLEAVWSDSAPSERTVRNWIAQFKEGRNSTEDSSRSGRPATAVSPENIQHAEDLITDNPRITTYELCSSLSIGISAVTTILHEHLNLTKVTARWVPKVLTPDMRQKRLTISAELLQLQQREAPDFLDRIVTGDESWFNFYEPESKARSMEWRHPGETPPTKVKPAQGGIKRMATVFWDGEGILLLKWLPDRQTINSNYYCEILAELKESTKKNRRSKWSRGVFLQHDNARPHTSAQTQTAIQSLGFTILPHPPYSADLAPSDYWLFGEMNKHLRGRRFETLQQLETAISKWRQDTPIA